MFRKWLIGSIVLHLGLIFGSCFWFPRFSAVPPEEVYLEIFTDSSAEDKGDPLAAVVSKILIRQEFGPNRAVLGQAPFRDGEKMATPVTVPVQPVQSTADPKVNSQAKSKREPAAEPKTQNADLSATAQPDFVAAIPGGSLESPRDLQNTTGEATTAPAGIGGVAKNRSAYPDPPPGSTDHKPGSAVTGLPVVDTPAVILKDVKPVYPAIARRNHWSGTVVLLVEVRVDGKVGEVIIIQSSGYQILDQEGVRAVKKRRYQPNLQDGKPVVVFRKVPYTFKLEG